MVKIPKFRLYGKDDPQIDKLANEGWVVKSKEVTQQGWSAGKTIGLGVLFLPLALLGKKPNIIQVMMERDKK